MTMTAGAAIAASTRLRPSRYVMVQNRATYQVAHRISVFRQARTAPSSRGQQLRVRLACLLAGQREPGRAQLLAYLGQ